MLRRSQQELKRQVAELTAVRNRLTSIIECELSYAAKEAATKRPAGDPQ